MSAALEVIACLGLASVQDMGRPGLMASGLQRGGAMDPRALAEGAALLGQPEDAAALEIIGASLTLRATVRTRIALTGAPGQARIGTDPALRWAASYALGAGETLTVTSQQGCAYLHVAGGFQTPVELGGRAANIAQKIGDVMQAGRVLPILPDTGGPVGRTLPVADRFGGGVLRVVPGPQTDLFTKDQRRLFESIALGKDARSSRTAARLDGAGERLKAPGGLSFVSDIITPGDIQITGDGTPFILMSECSTTGGYPRLGSVIPADLPRVAQAPVGALFTFQWVTLEEAVRIELADRAAKRALPSQVTPLVRDPADVPDLLALQLISGVVSARD